MRDTSQARDIRATKHTRRLLELLKFTEEESSTDEMSLPRRFLNLIVENSTPGAKSLRSIDLRRQRFFNTRRRPESESESGGVVLQEAKRSDADNNPEPALKLKMEMERIQLPSPTFNFRAATMSKQWVMHCFPLAGREVLCADQSGRTFLFNGDTRDVMTVPDLLKPKSLPISLFVPSADADGDGDGNGNGGRLYIMESILEPEARCTDQHSDQFEVFVFGKPTSTPFNQLLVPPPFVRDPKYLPRYRKISSYAVVGGGSQICISVEGAGTYRLDTVSHTWSHVGEWMLPFRGNIEYVPELKLWFGLSASNRCLAAADLSTMDSHQPELMETWKELDPPKKWLYTQASQLVNLGSGRFCITRFFRTRTRMGYYGDRTSCYGGQIIEDDFTVFTCVEVVPCVHDGNGKLGLRMIKHTSKLNMFDGSCSIKAVF